MPRGPVANGHNLTLRSGDRVTVRSGTAQVALPAGGHLDLRAGSVVRFQSGPSLEAGDLLVQSGPTPVRVEAAIGEVAVAGAARIRHDLALEVGTYRGTATLISGRTLVVGWLREVIVPSVGVAPDPIPLHLVATDSWDTRFLGQALDLTSELDSRTSYVNANSPSSGTDSAVFYRHALRPLATTASFDDDLLHSTSSAGTPPPGDALVAASIALSGPGPFADRWRAVFDLRAQGAQWGIVVLDQHADPNSVLKLLDGAVSATTVAPTEGVLAESNPATLFPSHVATTLPAPRPFTAPGPAAATTTTTVHTTTTAPPPRPITTTTTIIPIPTVPPAQNPSMPLAPVVDPVIGIVSSLTSTQP